MQISFLPHHTFLLCVFFFRKIVKRQHDVIKVDKVVALIHILNHMNGNWRSHSFHFFFFFKIFQDFELGLGLSHWFSQETKYLWENTSSLCHCLLTFTNVNCRKNVRIRLSNGTGVAWHFRCSQQRSLSRVFYFCFLVISLFLTATLSVADKIGWLTFIMIITTKFFQLLPLFFALLCFFKRKSRGKS